MSLSEGRTIEIGRAEPADVVSLFGLVGLAGMAILNPEYHRSLSKISTRV